MQNTLARKIGKLPVKQRMLAGFGLMLALLVLIAAQTLTSVLAIRNSATSVVSEYQPAVMITKTLNDEVNGALASLALFLLNKDEENKQMYLERVDGIEVILQQLRSLNPIQNNEESAKLVDRIEAGISKVFRGYEERMFDLSQNWQNNFPGMGYSAKTLNPSSQVMLQNINTMIQSELEQGDAAPRQALIQKLNELRYSWARIMGSVRAFLAFRNQESIAELELQATQFGSIMDAIKQQFGGNLLFEQEDAIEKIDATYSGFADDWAKTVQLHSSDQWRQDAYLIRSEMAPILKTLFNDINELTRIQVDNIEKENNLLISKSNTTAVVVIIVLLVTMAAVAGLAYMLIRGIINPIQHAVTEGISSIKRVMKEHAAADLDIASSTDDSGDSIDNVGKTFRIMTTTLQKVLDDQEEAHEDLEGKIMMILDVVRLAANGDLTGEMMIFSGKSEVDELAIGVQTMLDNLNSLSHKVRKSVDQVTTNVAEISSTAHAQEKAVEQQAANTNEIMATISQIASTSRELANTMKEVSETSYDNAQGAEKGQAALLRMEGVMKKMRDSTVSVTGSLETLSAKAEKINSVVTTIIKIANQTNLLSLNAAIEAEKAGEYGKGFTVVSSEIRRLADQTAVAIWDIEKMVSEMQDAVTKSTKNIRHFSGEISVGADEVAQVGHILGDIIEQVQILTPRFENVMEGMNTQHQSSEQIRERMRELNTIAQNTAKSLHQYGSSVQQLNKAAHELQDEFSMLKLTNENT